MKKSKQFLQYIQHKLFSVGSYLATDPERTEIRIESRISEDSITKLEKAIDEINSSLPSTFGIYFTRRLASSCRLSRMPDRMPTFGTADSCIRNRRKK